MPRTIPARHNLFMGFALAALLGACAPAGPPPVSQQPGATAPQAGERIVLARDPASQAKGDELHPEVLKRFGGVYDNPRVSAHVEAIGRRLVAVTPQPAEKWTFTVLDTPDINAFALPGGYIYVTRGLVALSEDEAALAGVVAHEIAHVTARHSARREQRTQVAGAGLLLGSLGLAALGLEPPVVGSLLQTALGGALASYSRDDEREADQVGIAYLAAAGYDPTAQADFLDVMARSARLDAQVAGRRYDPEATGFFATHPATAGRSREARATAAATGVTDGERGVAAHLAAIEGMAWGPSAAQGFVKDGAFVHPVLDFRFDVPEGWALANQPDAVVLAARDGTRAIFDGDNARGLSPEDYISRIWGPAIKQAVTAGDVSQLERREIGGAPAARALMPIRLGDTSYTGLLVAIARGDQVYRFIGLVPRGRRSARTVAAMTDSFRRLTPAEKQEARQRRIAVEAVRGGQDEAAFAARMNVEDAPLERFRVINDREPGDPLNAGARVKLVR
ncbi:MAG: M48 family metalloprotease [Pseudomonadota bacterium]